MHQKKLLLILVFITVLAIFFAPFIYGFYVAANYQLAEISNLSAGYSKNDEIILSEEIPSRAEHIYVCGNLKTTGSNYLTVSLHDATEQIFFGRGDSSGPYQAGQFCVEIRRNSSLTAGTYKVIIIDQHERVGELLFYMR